MNPMAVLLPVSCDAELVPEDEGGYRMEDRDAEGSTKDRMGG